MATTLVFMACSDDDGCTETTWYADTDNDGLGNPASSTSACEQPDGYVSNSDDEDDTVAYCETSTWYEDADGDGLGNGDVSQEACDQPDGYVANANDEFDVANTRYTVSAEVDGESYFITIDELMSGSISIVGNGSEGFAGIAASTGGYLYILNNTEGLLDKFELTENGPVKEDAISLSALTAGGFFRYIQLDGQGNILLLSNPGDSGAPYAIVDIETFAATSSGFVTFPTIDGKDNLWSNAVVQGNEIYFGTVYGDAATWTELTDSLVTIKFDYPAMTNPVALVSTASAGMVAGYRTNGSFVTENGDIYQYNMTSELWYEHDEVADKPSVFVRIKDGDYDDYVLDVSAEFDEPIAIWNAWYAGNGIAYANVVRVADTPEWGDLLQNTGTLVEINLETKSVTELNLPKATFRDIFTLGLIEGDKFYVPVSITGGEANIYEITIGGGADGFTKGASLDGSNVSINGLFSNQ
nr:hypothetical protein [Allomuricauda sp.]